jgi:outer membrane protein
MVSRFALAVGLAAVWAGGAEAAGPSTLQEALAAAYANNPTLLTARAQLRATDEGVPAALSGWRPQVSFTGSAGRAAGSTSQYNSTFNTTVYGRLERNINASQLQLTQPIYSGGKVSASTHKARNQVLAARAQLLATEEQVFENTISAYVSVVQTEQILRININTEQILVRQLQSTNARFSVGELTRTDVAQSEAALASATAARQTAEGNVQSARAQFERYVGVLPGKLADPQPLSMPAKSVDEAKILASKNNPNVVAALFSDAAAKDNFDVAYSALLPTINLQVSGFHNNNQLQPGLSETGGQILGNLTVPIFQGGAEYAGIRQARQQEIATRKQLDDQRRQAVQQAASAWEQVLAARAAITSDKASVRANEIAVEGLEREAQVGSRTTTDVLTGIENLLQAQTALANDLANLVNATYQVASAVGRLTARDMNLNVPLYDDKAYYNAVQDLWIGTGDYATDQPGR